MPKYYISFGQCHAHSVGGKTFDKDCIAEIEAETKSDAHKLAMDVFNKKFHNVYEEKPDMNYFPRGIINLNSWAV